MWTGASPAAMKVTVAGALLLALLLPGCAKEPPSEADGVASSAAPAMLLLDGCYEYRLTRGAPRADAEAAMPEGFSPVPFGPTGDDAAYVTVVVGCDRADAPEGTPRLRHAIEGFVATPVDSWAVEDALHVVAVLAYADDPARVTELRAVGFDAAYANISFYYSGRGPIDHRGGWGIVPEEGAPTAGDVNARTAAIEVPPPLRVLASRDGAVLARWDLVPSAACTQEGVGYAHDGDAAAFVPAGASRVEPGEATHLWGAAYAYATELAGASEAVAPPAAPEEGMAGDPLTACAAS